MKKVVLTILCLAGLVLAANAQSGHKILVAYFSWSGNTRAAAEQIAKETGGTLFEIKTVAQYPNDYHAFVDKIKSEQQSATARPELSTKVDNMEQYDTVFLGWPTWWGQMPMAVASFLNSYNFAGKTICPFNLSGSSGFGRSLALLKRETPRATIKNGLEIYAYSTNRKPRLQTPDSKITAWLKKLGYK
jgi:flavodoxin